MTLTEILDLVNVRAVVLAFKEGKLHIDARKELLTAEFKASLLQHKAKLFLIAKTDIPDFRVIWRDVMLSDGRKDKEPTFECSHCAGHKFWAFAGSDTLPSCSNCRPIIGESDRRIYWVE